MKKLTATAGMLLGLFVVSANVTTANAAFCEYQARYEGRSLVKGAGNHRKMKKACDRARRRCKRRLNRKRRQNKVGRGVSCQRVQFFQ